MASFRKPSVFVVVSVVAAACAVSVVVRAMTEPGVESFLAVVALVGVYWILAGWWRRRRADLSGSAGGAAAPGSLRPGR